MSRGDSAPDDAPLIPLSIGIIGKTALAGRDGEVGELVAKRLEQLAGQFPSSPLWVLTSAADGADWAGVMAAARLARTSRAVRLVLVLPFERSLYAQDFSEAHQARFDRLLDERTVELADGPLVLEPGALQVVTLAPLAGADAAQMQREPRTTGASGPHRTIHYEQAGIFIGDHCNLVMAVQPAGEVPGKIGGTARTAYYCRHGGLPPVPAGAGPTLDELLRRLEANCSPALPATPEQPTNDPGLYRLRRLSSELAYDRVPDKWLATRASFVMALAIDGGAKAEATETEAFRRLKALDRYNERARKKLAAAGGAGTPTGAGTASPYADPDKIKSKLEGVRPALAPGLVAALADMFGVRRMIADLQREAKGRADRAIMELAVLFVLSVLMFTLFKVYHHPLTGLAYLGLIAAAVWRYVHLRANHWSTMHDEFRAVIEALRVQMWWRLVGIPDSVEHAYGPGVHGGVERVREVIAKLNRVIALRQREAMQAGAAELAQARPALLELARVDWIGKQAEYFRREHEKRAVSGARLLMASIAAFGSGIGLFAWVMADVLREHAHVEHPPVMSGVGYLLFSGVMLAALLTFAVHFREAAGGHRAPEKASLPVRCGVAVRRGLDWIAEAVWRRIEGVSREHPQLRGVVRFGYPLLWGLGPVLLGWFLADLAARLLHPASTEALDHAIGVVVAVLAGIAGALVYVREKLAIEPEERNYAEMKDLMGSIEAMLAQKPDLAPEVKVQVLRTAGRAALAESAAWFRAHQERPIEPPMGG